MLSESEWREQFLRSEVTATADRVHRLERELDGARHAHEWARDRLAEFLRTPVEETETP